jgi:hypothetical protein
MRIALDYDGTYTADPGLWQAFIEIAKARGHEVVCVTMRNVDEVMTPFGPSKYYFTDRKAKVPAMAQEGINIDIWIDDQPQWLMGTRHDHAS